MGEPIGLSMRGGASKPAPHSNHSEAKDLKPIRLASLFAFDQFLSEPSPNFQLKGVVIQGDSKSSFGPIDWIDKTTWAAEGVGTLGGLGLLIGRNDTLSHWAGTFMISASVSNVFWEWIDRRHHLAHDHRLPRLALSLVTGMAVSNLAVLGLGGFQAGGLGGDPSRNPISDYGP